MNTFKIAFRRLFKKGEHTTIRIISLSAGLTFGILLLSEVFYYYSFDSFYPDANLIYVVHENFKLDKSSDKLECYPNVSGAIAPGLKAEVPGIESATRLNSIGSHVFYDDNLKRYEAKFSLADEYLFDVLPRPVISGKPENILKSPMRCMVSCKIAENMGGDVIGKVIELKRYPGKKLTIAGVFETLPENTNYKYDVLISMVSTNQFFSWDGSTNWMGNDRYYACVKLEPGVNPQSLAPAVREMQKKHQNIEKMEEERGGMVLKYSLKPLKDIYPDSVRDMIIILSTIAVSVLFVSLMNYILLTMSALVNRAKTSVIHKTCGAQIRNLQQLIFSETFMLFLVSLTVAVLAILILKPMAETQVGHNLSSALNSYVIWPLLLVIMAMIVITSYLPGRFFSRIPIAIAFRDYRQKRNKWKLGLLSFLFIGSSFILTVMVIVTMQYDTMKSADHGYRSEGVYYGATTGMDYSKISTVLNELRTMPEIETVGLGFDVPINGASGNNVYSPDGKRDLFNVADFYFVDENYFSILDIPVTEGQNFSPKTAATNDILISRRGAELLKLNNGWIDGVIGKDLTISEHGTSTVCGIFPDFIINSISDPDLRPSVFFYMPEDQFIQREIEDPSILIKVHDEAQTGVMEKITDVFNLAMPHNDAVVKSLEDDLLKNYTAERGFRNAMITGNIVILLITIIGLLGYTTNEATRRRKELAIRRINGAHFSHILKVFVLDLEFIAVPSVLAGLIIAWFTVSRWMQNFATKIPLYWEIFALCSLFILFLVTMIAAANYTRTANHNPVEALRYE
jgi:putative ABC transport system permease protein